MPSPSFTLRPRAEIADDTRSWAELWSALRAETEADGCAEPEPAPGPILVDVMLRDDQVNDDNETM